MDHVIIDLDENIVKFVEDNKIDNEYDDINILESIEKVVDLVVDDQNIHADKIYVSIQSASKEEIRKINNEFRNIDKSTDVLSFPIFSSDELIEMKTQIKGDKKLREIELGDIILCLDVVKEHSIEYNTGIVREVLYMIVHGMCHLLGYDHEIENEKVKMRELEEKILNLIGVNKLNG